MGRYMRVLGLADPDIPPEELRVLEKGGQVLARVERNPVKPGEFGKAELDDFRELIQECEPASAVRWLLEFFDRVQVIYAFELLPAAFEGDNYEIVSTLKAAIWERTGGILQADDEGFSNEDGYHILWQFDETVSGDLYCAVIDDKGAWQRFRMDLGDVFQRMAFQAGEVPANAVRL